MKKPHEYWYCFGGCTPKPVQINEGCLPREPYKRFETKEECQAYIDSNKGGINNVYIIGEGRIYDTKSEILLPSDERKLKKQLDKAVENEDYEKAAVIRDALKIPK